MTPIELSGHAVVGRDMATLPSVCKPDGELARLKLTEEIAVEGMTHVETRRRGGMLGKFGFTEQVIVMELKLPPNGEAKRVEAKSIDADTLLVRGEHHVTGTDFYYTARYTPT